MNLDDLIPLVARLLGSRRIPYFVFGGVGVSLWGRPRTTHDLDVVVRIERSEISGLASDLREAGFRITRLEERKLGEGRLLRIPIGATELDLRKCRPGHDVDALKRAKRASFANFDLWVATPEDLVLYKLQSWRTQDRADIENLVATVKSLDRRYIARQIPAIERAGGAPLRERWREVTSRRRPSASRAGPS